MKTLLIAAVLVLALTSISEAKRYQTVTDSGKEVTAHTNLAPVVVHKVLPPYGLGKHVYEGRRAK